MGDEDTTEESKRSSYNSDYYQRNKERLSALRKEKYLSDPEYKGKCMAAALRRKASLAEKRRSEGKKGLRLSSPTVFNVEIGGVSIPVKMFSTGQLARVIGRKAQALRLWEKNGMLPGSLYRKGNGERLYTEFQVNAIAEAFESTRRKYGKMAYTRISQTDFPALLKQIWVDYPLGIEPG